MDSLYCTEPAVNIKIAVFTVNGDCRLVVESDTEGYNNACLYMEFWDGEDRKWVRDDVVSSGMGAEPEMMIYLLQAFEGAKNQVSQILKNRQRNRTEGRGPECLS